MQFRLLPAMVIAAVSIFASVPTKAQQGTVERDLIKLENDWGAALQKKDFPFLQKLWADEYLSTDQDGNTFTKAQDLANFSDRGTGWTAFALTDLKVHVYGDAAVVTGLNTVKSTFKGKDTSGAYRFTDVFVKRDGRWQVVATQGSLVAKK